MPVKRPSFQYYPADWRKDSALQSCSMAARGLWHEMNCIMHECVPYGHLSINNEPMTMLQLSRLVGETVKNLSRWENELRIAGVFSINDKGIIFCRRMVKDEELRNTRQAAGKLGGNPNLVNQNASKPPTKAEAITQPSGNQELKQNLTPSSSSSSSSSCRDNKHDLTPDIVQEGASALSVAERAREMNRKMALGEASHFGRFRELYPKPGNWLEAEIAWRQHKCDAQADVIFADIPERHAKDAHWQEARYIPNPENYLKREVWKNAIVPKSTKAVSGGAREYRTVAEIRSDEERNEHEKLAAQQSMDRFRAGALEVEFSHVEHVGQR